MGPKESIFIGLFIIAEILPVSIFLWEMWIFKKGDIIEGTINEVVKKSSSGQKTIYYPKIKIIEKNGEVICKSFPKLKRNDSNIYIVGDTIDLYRYNSNSSPAW